MKRFAFYIFLATLLLSATATAGVPHLMNYQGRLTDTAGIPLAGQQFMKFMIWDAAEGGNSLWSSVGYVSITTSGSGLFNYILGSSASLPDSLSNYDSLWLEITVNSDQGILSPRTRLISSPFALKAEVAERVVASRDLYHQIIDVNPNSTVAVPFVARRAAPRVTLYLYGGGYQGTVASHTHEGVNAHAHDLSGIVESASVSHTHAFSGTTADASASHSHSASSGATNVSHTHGGNVGYSDPWHFHPGTTASSTAHSHTLAVDGYPGTGIYLTISGGGEFSSSNTDDRFCTGSVMLGGEHIHGFNTDVTHINHNHGLTINSWTGGSHTHSITVNSATAIHGHGYTGTTGSNDISHDHGFSGTALSTGDGLWESGITPGTTPSEVWIVVDGVPAVGPFNGEFSSGAIDLSSFVQGANEHVIEIREQGGTGGRITYNLFVE